MTHIDDAFWENFSQEQFYKTAMFGYTKMVGSKICKWKGNIGFDFVLFLKLCLHIVLYIDFVVLVHRKT